LLVVKHSAADDFAADVVSGGNGPVLKEIALQQAVKNS